MSKIKIGAFGAFRGLVLMQSMAVMPEAEIVAVLDKNPEALKNVKLLADSMGIKPALYTDFEDFFKHDMDAVILANFATEAEMAEWPIDPEGVVAYHTATFNGMKGWNPTPYGYDIDNFIYRASQFVTVNSLKSLVTGSQLAQTMADYPAAVNARIADPAQTMLGYPSESMGW